MTEHKASSEEFLIPRIDGEPYRLEKVRVEAEFPKVRIILLCADEASALGVSSALPEGHELAIPPHVSAIMSNIAEEEVEPMPIVVKTRMNNAVTYEYDYLNGEIHERVHTPGIQAGGIGPAKPADVLMALFEYAVHKAGADEVQFRHEALEELLGRLCEIEGDFENQAQQAVAVTSATVKSVILEDMLRRGELLGRPPGSGRDPGEKPN